MLLRKNKYLVYIDKLNVCKCARAEIRPCIIKKKKPLPNQSSCAIIHKVSK